MGKLAKIADKRAAKEDARESKLRRFAELLVLKHKADGDSSQLQPLQDFLEQNPDLCEGVYRLAKGVRTQLLQAMASGAGTQLFIEKEVEQLQARLTDQNASPVEGLLIDALLLCWLRVQYAETFRTCYLTGSHTIREIEFAEKMLTHSHRRFDNACKSLARVQQLSISPKKPIALDKPVKAMRLLKTPGAQFQR